MFTIHAVIFNGLCATIISEKSEGGRAAVNLLTAINARPKFMLRAVICMIVPFIAEEVYYFAWICARAGENIASVGVTHLRWSYSAFYAITVAAAYTLIVCVLYTFGPRQAAKIIGIYAALRALSEGFAFLCEKSGIGVEGDIAESDSIMNAVSHISDFFAAVALAFGVWIIAAAFLRLYKAKEGARRYSAGNAVNFAILFEFIVSLMRFVVSSGISFAEEGGAVTVEAIRLFVYGSVEKVVFFAVFAFICSRVVLFICTEREF